MILKITLLLVCAAADSVSSGFGSGSSSLVLPYPISESLSGAMPNTAGTCYKQDNGHFLIFIIIPLSFRSILMLF
jgi:hypothetical protein